MYQHIARQIPFGTLPSASSYLLASVFAYGSYDVFMTWLKQQIKRFSNGQVHLTETNDPTYVMGPGRVFTPSGPLWSKKLFIGPYDDGIEWHTR